LTEAGDVGGMAGGDFSSVSGFVSSSLTDSFFVGVASNFPVLEFNKIATIKETLTEAEQYS
jgi:hypothetical protein